MLTRATILAPLTGLAPALGACGTMMTIITIATSEAGRTRAS